MAGRQRKPVDSSGYQGRLAEHLRKLCDAKGLSIEQLAENAGLPKSNVYAYLSGERGIPADYFPAIAKALGVNATEFLPGFRTRK